MIVFHHVCDQDDSAQVPQSVGEFSLNWTPYNIGILKIRVEGHKHSKFLEYPKINLIVFHHVCDQDDSAQVPQSVGEFSLNWTPYNIGIPKIRVEGHKHSKFLKYP